MIPTFVITLREGVEAPLIVGIISPACGSGDDAPAGSEQLPSS